MAFPWEAIIGGGSSLLGGLIGADSQERTNDESIKLAREQRDWEERMANTAYQRSRVDMEKAGLNPILMAKMGGSATPTYANPTLQSPGTHVTQGLNSAVQNALNVQSIKAQIETQKTQQTLNSANAVSAGQDARRKALENDYLAQKFELDKWISKRKLQNRKLAPWMQDVEESINILNPFGSVHAGQGYKN